MFQASSCDTIPGKCLVLVRDSVCCAVLLSLRCLAALLRPCRRTTQPEFVHELWHHLRNVNVGFDADCEKVEQLAAIELSKSFQDSPDPLFYNTA